MNSSLEETTQSIRTSIPELSAQIITVFIFPIVLLVTGILPLEHRVLILGLLVGALSIVLIAERWTPKMLGFRYSLSRSSIVAYLIFTTLGVVGIMQLGKYLGYTPVHNWWHNPHFLYLFLIVSGLQEIAYRGYLMPALATFEKSSLARILTNAALFTFLHAIFPNYIVNLPLAFIGGVGFAYMYNKYPSILLISISHAVLNFVAVWLGFFTL